MARRRGHSLPRLQRHAVQCPGLARPPSMPTCWPSSSPRTAIRPGARLSRPGTGSYSPPVSPYGSYSPSYDPSYMQQNGSSGGYLGYEAARPASGSKIFNAFSCMSNLLTESQCLRDNVKPIQYGPGCFDDPGSLAIPSCAGSLYGGAASTPAAATPPTADATATPALPSFLPLLRPLRLRPQNERSCRPRHLGVVESTRPHFPELRLPLTRQPR